jgi:glycosyltransferase involved in cell wall biosynthesis
MVGSRPQVLAILPIFGPSTIMCVVKPFIQLHRAGYIKAKIKLESFVNRRDIEGADLVVFCRNTEPRYAHWLDFVLHRDMPYIYELDDNFFEIPLDAEFGKYHRAPERLALMTRYMSQADLVRVYSEPLVERAQPLNSRVERVVGPVDLSLVSPPLSRPDQARIKLVYATSRSVDKLADIFTPALMRVLDEYSDHVEVHFWGYYPLELRTHRGTHFHPVLLDYDRFLRKFSCAGFDIGLAPLLDDIFYRSKTNNKFREYGASRIAGIYSDVDVYSTCVTNGETGLLVPNQPQAWYDAIVRLIEDYALRDKIKNQAQEYVRQHYSQENFEQVWLTHIQHVLANHPTQAPEDRPLETEKLAMLSEQENGSQKLLNPLRRISKGPKIIYCLVSQSPRAALATLHRYWNTLWILLKIRYLMSPAADLIIRLSSSGYER